MTEVGRREMQILKLKREPNTFLVISTLLLDSTIIYGLFTGAFEKFTLNNYIASTFVVLIFNIALFISLKLAKKKGEVLDISKEGIKGTYHITKEITFIKWEEILDVDYKCALSTRGNGYDYISIYVDEAYKGECEYKEVFIEEIGKCKKVKVVILETTDINTKRAFQSIKYNLDIYDSQI